jgi:hypothetical protein
MNPAALQHALIALVIAVAIVAVVRFEVFCLRDLAKAEDQEQRYLSRSAWVVVIAVSIPVGGILYLFYGRTR